jgi:hypothetical protein
VKRWLALLGASVTTGCSLLLAGDLDDARDPVVEVKPPSSDASVDSGASIDANGEAEAGPTGYPAVVLADAPAAYWRLEDTSGTMLHDELGHFDLTITDATGFAFSAPGIRGGRAISTNGAAEMQATGVVSTKDDVDFTIEAWVRPTFTDTHYGTVFEKNVVIDGQRDGMLFWVNPGREVGSAFEVWTNKMFTQAANATFFPTTRFTHVVVTREALKCFVYIDGVQQSTTADHTTISDSSPVLSFGNGMVGDFDELAAYTHALGADRVRAHFEAGK